MQLRDYQAQTIDWCQDWFATAKPGDRKLFAAPTGTGKSLIELGILESVPGSWLISPSLTIIAGMLQKLGLGTEASEDKLIQTAWDRRITTPVRLRNRMIEGSLPNPPSALIFDEAHHDLASTWQDIHPLCGHAPAVAFTASPYRGTPKGTAAFRQQWGEPKWLITYREAMDRGYLSMPRCEVVPLVDDDSITVQNGELVVSEIEAATLSRLDAVVNLCLDRGYVTSRGSWLTEIGRAQMLPSGLWDTPTMFSVPTREIASLLCQMLTDSGCPAEYVTAETSQGMRQRIFKATIERKIALIHINVVSEGVDLPIRRLIDLNPTLSPVRWIQQVGRIMRPGGESEYICTNRNLMRHGYLLDGCLPPSTFAECIAAFGTPGKRAAIRAFGLEGLGKFKAAEIPCKDGITALAYALSRVDEHRTTQYCAIVHPARSKVVWAKRENAPYIAPVVELPDGKIITDAKRYMYGRWERCDEPGADFRGFSSLTPSPVTDKQRAWWRKSADWHGLDAGAKINNKQFQILPVLSDLRCKL